MFQSLNLFKSINCPFYSQVNNTLNCDRPHCQFKHPTIFLANNKISNKQEIIVNENNETNNNNKLPSMLENLSNALQTVQQIINASSSSSSSFSLSNNNNSIQTQNQINATLASLNNVLQSVTSTEKSSLSSSSSISNNSSPIKKSSRKNLKRQQSAPDYNPTPIEELKKLNESNNSNQQDDDDDDDGEEQDEIENKEEEDIKRRKSLVENDTNSKKLKIEKTTTTSSCESSPILNSNNNNNNNVKCDLVTFSKLSLSQQVLKRYEMLNKQAPSAAAIQEAKLKKHQSSAAAAAAAAVSSTNKTGTDLNVPRLIIDANSGNKVPLIMRQRYLKMIFDNGKSSFATIQKACQKAAEQEKSIFDRAKNKTIYLNLTANLIRSLKTQSQMNNQTNNNNNINNKQIKTAHSTLKTTTTTTNTNMSNTTMSSYSHESMLSGPKANKVSYSINRIKQLEFKDLSSNLFFNFFVVQGTYFHIEINVFVHIFFMI